MSAFDLLSFSSWIKENLILFWWIVGAVAVAIVLVISFFIIRRAMKRKPKSASVESVLAKSGAKIEVSPDKEIEPVELKWKLEPTPAPKKKPASEKKASEKPKKEPVKEPAVEEAPAPVEELAVEEVPASVEEPAVEEVPTPVEEPAVEEVPAPAEEPAVEEKVIVKQVSQPAFNFITVRYDRSFEARVIQLDDVGKDFYSQIKNELLSYPKVKSRMSWRHEAFRLGRQTVAKMQCRGRTLCVYLALDPKQYAETKYLVEDVSDVKKNAQTPCLYRIKNERRCRYVKQLIADLFASLGIAKGAEQEIDYKVPYEPLKPLLARGLVKRIEVKSNVLGEVAPATSEEDDDDDIVEVIRVPVEEEEPVEESVEEVVEEPVEETTEEPVEEPVEEPAVAEEPTPVEEPEEERVSVSVVEAQRAMEDEVAVAAVAESNETSDKSRQVVVNVDTLSKYFRDGDRVTLKEMKEFIPFVPNKATYVKVLARGRINKSLEVEADDFSLDAVKMIVLAGGKVIRKKSI